MRFVLGIVIGGSLGLLLAAHGTPPWVSGLSHSLQTIPGDLELRPTEQPLAATVSGNVAAAGVTHSAQPQSVDGEKPLRAELDGPDVQQARSKNGHDATPETGVDERAGLESENGQRLSLSVDRSRGDAHLQYQSAWSVFRSQTSARGFAARMSRDLARDFEVVKLGPGRYEVRFHWAVPEDRRSVLDAIAALTGFRPLEDDRAASL